MRARLIIGVATVVWVAAIVGGGATLLRYSGTAGAVTPAPTSWPVASHVSPQGDETIVMFAHPFCPCTNASLAELDRLLAATGKRATVLFLDPSTEDENWRSSALVQRAQAIAGVTVGFDEGGAEAKLFGAHTSGHVVVYDARGALVYAGGITQARGHEGWAAGQQAVRDFLTGRDPGGLKAPTYGCALDGPRNTELADKGELQR